MQRGDVPFINLRQLHGLLAHLDRQLINRVGEAFRRCLRAGVCQSTCSSQGQHLAHSAVESKYRSSNDGIAGSRGATGGRKLRGSESLGTRAGWGRLTPDAIGRGADRASSRGRNMVRS